MREEIVVAIVMIGVSVVGSIVTRNKRKWDVLFLLLAAVAGSLVAGMGIRFREIVEGPFGYLDAMLSVTAATLFVFLFNRSGAFEPMLNWILKAKNKPWKAFMTLVFIAAPASFTGFAGASLLTTGALAAKALEKGGVEKRKITEVVAIGSFIGMLMPPNCIPAIIAANGAGSVLPTPYNGFYAPLLVISLLVLVIYWAFNIPSLSAGVGEGEGKLGVMTLLIKLVALAAMFDGLCGKIAYIGGNTLWFFLGSIAVIALEKGFGSPKACFNAVSDSLMEAVVPVAFVFALGSFIEVSSMTGVRGIYSLKILPYSETNVMLVIMLLGVLLGIFFSLPVPAFLMAYAVFPIGWLANPVIVTGISMALAVVCLVTVRGSLFERTADVLGYSGVSRKETLKATIPVVLLVLLLGVIFVVCGDGFLSVLNF